MALLYGVAVTSGAAMPGLTSLGADQLAGRSQRQKSRYFTVVAMAIALGQVIGTTVVTYVDSELGRSLPS
jgi:MFS family permease